jgi:two-component system, chemotaxis family, protein-glutamate methylesterase/glutaminase
MIKVLIVDDSAFMRIALRKMVECADIQVVGEARNGAIGLQMARELRPDVITMDVEMPEMDGLTATREIMACAPCPIIMVSSLTEKGAATTIQALSIGAVDFISKKSSFVQLDIVQIGEELVGKIRYWAKQKKSSLQGAALTPSTPSAPAQYAAQPKVQMGKAPENMNKISAPAGKVGLVVVGISTGGPAAMPKFLQNMGRLACPVVIAQHMPPLFTKGFADHMRAETGLNIVEGVNGMQLEPGMVVVAPGGTDSIVREPFKGKLTLYLKLNTEVNIHPNADTLFRSVTALSVGVVAVIMTGMGSDGTLGATELHKRNVPILVQSPDCCVVDGMPSSAIAAGIVSEALPLDQLGRKLAKWCA